MKNLIKKLKMQFASFSKNEAAESAAKSVQSSTYPYTVRANKRYSRSSTARERDENSKLVERYSECIFSGSGNDTISVICKKIDSLVKRRKLYLEPNLGLNRLAFLIGSNRTYLSLAMMRKGGFRNYINDFRIKHFHQLLTDSSGQEGEENVLGDSAIKLYGKKITSLAVSSGFSDVRSLKRAVEESDNEYARQIKELLFG